MRLKFVDSDDLDITRRKLAHGWAYYAADGVRITDRDEIDRLNRIALPPAYTDARFGSFANGHLQAIGVDGAGLGHVPDAVDARLRHLVGDLRAGVGRHRRDVDLRLRHGRRGRDVAEVLRDLLLGRGQVDVAVAGDDEGADIPGLRGFEARR